MADFIRCPNCDRKNFATAIVCERCSTPLHLKGSDRAQYDNILIVTTPNIEGRPIAEYLGVVIANVVLGTPWGADWNATLADLGGGRSPAIQASLRIAAEGAFNELRQQAVERGADAVIAVDVDYNSYRDNMLMVVANGTAVRLQQKSAVT